MATSRSRRHSRACAVAATAAPRSSSAPHLPSAVSVGDFDARPDLSHIVEATCRALANSRHPLVKVAAAVEAAGGQVYVGVQVRSGNCSHCATCAEVVAIGNALAAGVTELIACVAVVH